MLSEWAELLDEIAEFLDGQADVKDGEGGRQLPNKAMQLHTRLCELRPEVRARDTEMVQALREIGKMPCISVLLGEYRDCTCASCHALNALAKWDRSKVSRMGPR